MAASRPWHPLPIRDNGEQQLLPLPPAILRLEPHPYQALGAPYGDGASPFQLRSGVIERLLQAQELLEQGPEGWILAVFDAWRPVTVQRFMVEHAFTCECLARGLDPDAASAQALESVREDVARFWADPSLDPATPPPHSTGAAVDLTLATREGVPLEMGGAIDAIAAVSEPDHYAELAAADPLSPAASWHRRRCRLAEVMAVAGFARHPNEWWHFSHGDQLWAWQLKRPAACYGRVPI